MYDINVLDISTCSAQGFSLFDAQLQLKMFEICVKGIVDGWVFHAPNIFNTLTNS